MSSRVMPPPALPDELWIVVLQHLDPNTLWLGARGVNHQFRSCAEDIARAHILSQFDISLNYTLGSGSHHRWYDIRGSITLGFKELSRLNPQYALFEKTQLHPQTCHGLAWEKWNRMCASGFGPEQEWRVQLYGNETHSFRLPRLVVSDSHGVWCDWREMLDAYFAETLKTNNTFFWL